LGTVSQKIDFFPRYNPNEIKLTLVFDIEL